MAAGLLLGAAGGWFLASGPLEPQGAGEPIPIRTGAVEGVAPFIEDFVQGAVPDDRRLTSEDRRVSDFIRDELDVAFSPPAYPGFELVGVEICVWGDKRGAVVMYQRMGQLLYHFVLAEDADVVRLEPRLSMASPERWRGERPSVAVWADGDREEALVGNLEPAALLALVRTAREHAGAGGALRNPWTRSEG